MKFHHLLLASCAIGLSAVAPIRTPAIAQRSAQVVRPAAAIATVDRAVAALGGAQKIAEIRNITAAGYGQYAYMMGGGRITGAVDAAEKYMAANEISRIYDLEHDRFAMRERRNMLFPFLDTFGHNFAPNDNRLDGDIAFDVGAGQFAPPNAPARRMPNFSESPLTLDGVHMRRMWMMQNPVVLIRAMTDPRTRLSAPRREGRDTAIDLTLRTGDRLTAAFGSDGLPSWMRFANPQTNLGQETLTTHYAGWVAWDGQGGVLMPLSYTTLSDWRNVDFFKMYVDAYQVNTNIPDLAAPAEVRAAPEPASYPVPPLTSVSAGQGVWRISNGTTVIAFKDHLVLFELNGNVRNGAKAILDYARGLAPGKPIRYLIASHNHFDHTAGLREAVAEGITIIQRPASLQQFKEAAEHPAPDYPDDLARNPKPFKGMPLAEHIRLQDETQTLDIYWGRNNGHMADVVFGYVPSAKLMMEGDLVTAAYTWQHWPDTFRDVIAYYKLDVEKVSPVHTQARVAPDLLTRAQAEELLSGGTKRAREHCATEQAKQNYHPGCPVQSKYY